MHTPALADLKSTYGSNKGGICYFEFCPKEWVAADLVMNPLQHTVTSSLQLLAGKTLLRADCLADSAGFSEKQKENKPGSFFEQKLSGVINKDELEKSLQLDTLRFHELVIIYYDKNGKKKIIGNRQHGMNVSSALEVEPTTAGKSFYLLELTHQTEHLSPFYMV